MTRLGTMRTVLRALCAVSAFVLYSRCALATDTIYFLVAELPGYVGHHDSYVLPLSKEEDISHARYLISRYGLGYSAGDRTIAVGGVATATDDINRNFLDPRFPKWSWQISAFTGFQDYSIEIGD